jgi:hypothetical protein
MVNRKAAAKRGYSKHRAVGAVLAVLALSGCVTQQEVRESAYNDCLRKGGSRDLCIAVGYQQGANWQAQQDRAAADLSASLQAAAIAVQPRYQPTVRLQTNCMRVGYMVSCN